MPEIAPRLKPRIILELADDGNVIMERYINGQRERTVLNDWHMVQDIFEALNDQQRRNDEDAKRRQAQKEREEQARHRRIWADTAYFHGEGFANRTINGNQYKGPSPDHRTNKAKINGIVSSEDLL